MGIFGYSREFKGDPPVGRKGLRRRPITSIQSYWLVLFFTFGLDGLSKWLITQTLVIQQSIPLVGHFLQLTYVRNTGAVFNLLAVLAQPWKSIIFIGVAVSALLVFTLMAYQSKKSGFLCMLALGLISGGILGNLMDRLWSGTVIDFIELSFKKTSWPVFNSADAAIVAGVCLLLFSIILKRLKR